MKIKIEVEAYRKLKLYIANVDEEISGLGYAKIEKNVITVYDVILLPQINSYVSTDMFQGSIAKYLDDRMKKELPIENLHLWWHCITGDTPVMLANGKIVSAERVYEIEKPKVISLGQNKFITSTINRKKSFVAPVFKIITTLNREIKVTANHQLLTPHWRWRQVSELEIGQKIAIPGQFSIKTSNVLPKYIEQNGRNYHYKSFKDGVKLGNKFVKIPKRIDDKLAELLGWLVADGNIDKGSHTLHFAQKDSTVLKHFNSLLFNVFGIKGEIYQPPLGGWRNRPKELRLTDCKAVGNYLVQLGLPCGRSGPKRIPPIIFRSAKKFKKTFLKAFIEGDGSYDKRGRILYKRIYTVHKELANDLMYLVTMLGYRCGVRRLKQNFPRGRRYLYDVYWNSTDKVSGIVDWVEIKEIISLGNEKVYAFSIPYHRNYLCGFGPFISHNSHASMEASWSMKDDETINDFDTEKPEENWFLSIVGNHQGDLLCRLDLFAPFRYTINEIPWEIGFSPNKELIKSIKKEIKEKVIVPLPKKISKKTKNWWQLKGKKKGYKGAGNGEKDIPGVDSGAIYDNKGKRILLKERDHLQI